MVFLHVSNQSMSFGDHSRLVAGHGTRAMLQIQEEHIRFMCQPRLALFSSITRFKIKVIQLSRF